MAAAVVHWEIMGKDGKKLQDFYSRLFGWNINSNNPMNYGLVDTGLKTGINGGIGQVPSDQSGYVAVYAQVEDPQSYLDKAVSLGARVLVPVTAIPDMVTYALFADPEGNMFGIVKGTQLVPKKTPTSRKKSPPRRKTSAGGRKKRSRR